MREEDEIRAAVIELARAQAAGEDIADKLPNEEALAAAAGGCGDRRAMPIRSEGERAHEEDTGSAGDFGTDPETDRERAVRRALDSVRTASRASRLAVPAEWAEMGLVPPSMTPEDLEMAVYDVLMEYGDPSAESAVDAGPSGASAAEDGRKPGSAAGSRCEVGRHVKSAFSSSNGRPVGAMGFKARKIAAPKARAEGDGAKEDIAGKDPAGGDLGRPSSSEGVLGREDGPVSAPTEEIPDVSGAAEVPDVSGAADAPKVAPLALSCAGIRLLMGAESYYLYDSAIMTDAYARWAFLAAEDDPVTTFIECVREESRVYPRPMAITNLANDPFCLEALVVEQLFDEARFQGRADDIERTEASNGDVYFYSTTYLSPVRAQALAEWDAVDRIRNV